MTIRYMTGESRQDEERHYCPRCDNYRGYVCAEHREPSYERLRAQLATAHGLLREAVENLDRHDQRDWAPWYERAKKEVGDAS